MSILIKSATILDAGSSYHNQKLNIFISDNGIIKSIGKETPKASKEIEGKNLSVSMGWFDMRANFNDPGFEYKEDMNSGLKTAAAGGFTGVALLPNTKPCVESKNEVSYLKSNNLKSVTQIYPMGAVTKGCKGEDFTEILDMQAAGAVAFTDGENPICNTDILLKTLHYLQKFNGFQILTAAMFIGDPLPFFSRVIQVKHGRNSIDTQAIDMKLIKPGKSTSKQKTKDFLTPIIKN